MPEWQSYGEHTFHSVHGRDQVREMLNLSILSAFNPIRVDDELATIQRDDVLKVIGSFRALLVGSGHAPSDVELWHDNATDELTNLKVHLYFRVSPSQYSSGRRYKD